MNGKRINCFFKEPSRRLSLLVSLVLGAFAGVLPSGCSSPSATVVEETDEYSYDEIMAQVAAEEEASPLE